MPSWNIHIAQVERFLDGCRTQDFGIADDNAFLFGNFVPDIYVGFMVPDVTMRIDYRVTHMAKGCLIPVPDADRFWDGYIAGSRPMDDVRLSLTLGAWAHILADRFYNGRFRTFWQTHDMPEGEQLRVQKQTDFHLFGRSLALSRHVDITPELLEAAHAYGQYSVLADDVARSVAVASDIVHGNEPVEGDYQLLTPEWMTSVFDDCDERLRIWLAAWQRLAARGGDIHAASIRAEAALPPATPDDPDWMTRVPA